MEEGLCFFFFSGRRKVSGYTLQKRMSKRTSPERVRSPCGLGRGGVSFSVASDHRDRDRCDQPPRSRCRGQHHYTVVRLVLFLSFFSFLSFSFFFFSLSPIFLSLSTSLPSSFPFSQLLSLSFSSRLVLFSRSVLL